MTEPVDLGTFPVVKTNPFVLPILRELDADGNGVELSTYGSSWVARARESHSSTASITFTIDASNAAGTVHNAPDAYRLLLSLPGDLTATMNGRYVCDLRVTGGTESPLTLYRWTLKTEDVVTVDA